MLKIRLLLVYVLLAWLTTAPAFAGEQGAADSAGVSEDSSLPPSPFSLGFSYPLIFAGSVGKMLPLGKPHRDNDFPSPPLSLRADGELGLGGGDVSLGLYVPVSSSYSSYSINLKAAILHTWLWPLMERSNRTYEGAVVELFEMPYHGVPAKFGLGAFRDTQPINNRHEELYYFFMGVGI